MASGSIADGGPHQRQEISAIQVEDPEAERQAIETAKSQLKKAMADVVDNPPADQKPAPNNFAEAQNRHDNDNYNELNFEDPLPDPYTKAITYLEQHNILQIFQHMTANIIYKKPENPLDFMIAEISEMKNRRDTAKK